MFIRNIAVPVAFAFSVVIGGAAFAQGAQDAQVEITDPRDGDTVSLGSSITVNGQFSPATLDANGDGFVVIAVADTGINPYHDDFAAATYAREGIDGAALFAQHPSTYLEGYPEGAPALNLTIDGNYNAAMDADAFSAVAGNTLYWIPGTKIIGAYDTGASSGVTGAGDTTPILDEDGHGTASASVSTGNIFGSCKSCLLVAVEGLSEEWVLSQSWIDISTNSFGAIGNIGFPVISREDATRAATERGQSVLYAAGNGNANAFLTPQQTYLPNTTGPDWTMTVGAIHNNNFPAPEGENSAIVGSGKPVDISSFGLGNIPAACHTDVDGNCGFSGTSAATPITAGHLGKIVETAREMLGDTNRVGTMRVGGDGPEGRGVVAFSDTPVADNAYLSDGEFTRAEAWHILFQAASPLTDTLIGFNNILGYGLGATPVDYAYTGYGVADDAAQEAALLMLENGDAMRRDTSDADDFFATDAQIRDALWGTWDSDMDTVPMAETGTSQLADLGINAVDVPADVDGFLNLYATNEADDDGVVPGVAGEVLGVEATQDGDFVEFALEVGPLDDAAPTLLGNPFSYQVEFATSHNGLQQDYTAAYRNEVVPTDGLLPDFSGDPQTFEITVSSAPNEAGLRSLCPTPISTEGSRTVFDEATGRYFIVWRAPLAEFTESTIAAQGACAEFERNGDGLEPGDRITGITGVATLKVATVTFGDFQDTATTDNLVVSGGGGSSGSEAGGCPSEQLLLAIADIEVCTPINVQTASGFSELLDTSALPAGDYALTATVFSGLTTVATDGITLTFSDDTGGGDPDPGENLTASLTANGESGRLEADAPVTVTFDASGSRYGNREFTDGDGVTYSFVFGDEASSDEFADPTSESVVTHTYEAAGEYDAYVIVRDGDSNSDVSDTIVIKTTVTITVTGDNGTVAQLTLDNNAGPAPLTVTFDGSQSFAAQGEQITEYCFDFDDGDPPTCGSESVVTYTYVTPGSYSPSLTVTSSDASTAKAEANVAIQGPGGSTPAPATSPGGGGGSGSLSWLSLLALAGLGGLRRRRA